MSAAGRPRLLPHYAAERLGLFVRIDPDLPKTVVFLGIDSPGGFVPVGTGFLVSKQLADTQDVFILVVTATHVIDNLSDQARALLAIRVNAREGPAKIVRVNLDGRFDHPNKGCDTTILSVDLDPAIQDFKMTSLDRQTAERDRAENGNLQPGDNVCAIGLYTSHHGLLNNAPVLRTGHVAAIPDEPVRTMRGYAEGILIELRTIAGLSGSPVFRTFEPVRVKAGLLQTRMSDISGGVLVGMLAGYHLVEKQIDQIQVPRDGTREASGFGDDYTPDELNTGFGVVIPIDRVFEVLESDEWKTLEAEALERFNRTNPFRAAGKFGLLTIVKR